MPDPKTGSDEIISPVFIVRQSKVKENQSDFKHVSLSTPVSGIIQDIIERHELPGTFEDYALVFQKSDKSDKKEITKNDIMEYKIVSEKNKHEMHGKIIELVDSPSKYTKKILQQINDVTIDSKDLVNVLEELKDMSSDPTFSEEFISQNGLQILMLGVSKQFRINEQAKCL